MILWMLAALVAYFVKGLCGFANTLVFSTILSFGVNNISITPVDLMLGFPSNVIIAWKERKNVQWKMCVLLVLCVIAGIIPGMFLLKNIDARIVKVIFGVAIIGLGTEMLLREHWKETAKESKLILICISLCSGLLCGLFGIGALMAACVGRIAKNVQEFRGTICIVFIVENIFRIVAYSFLGILSWNVLLQALYLAPAMGIGLFLGMKSTKLIDEKRIKKIIIIMLILSGIALIIKNI